MLQDILDDEVQNIIVTERPLPELPPTTCVAENIPIWEDVGWMSFEFFPAIVAD